jgi:CRISPR-associated endonuclease/helicase Cas3
MRILLLSLAWRVRMIFGVEIECGEGILIYYAHSFEGEGPGGKWQLLKEHLQNVAELAAGFAKAARPGDAEFIEAERATGLLHDLGKYRPEFQEMIRNRRQKGESTRHKQFGAAHARCAKRWDVAFSIMGHHGGLPDAQTLKNESLGIAEHLPSILSVAANDYPAITHTLAPIGPTPNDLPVRLLFSCLVDADWIDTGNHAARMRGQPTWSPPEPLDYSALISNVKRFIKGCAGSCRDMHVASIRAEVLNAAEKASAMAPGLFSMTVPTGGGKTLSSLMFALRHAQAHGLDRIIYVAPYLTIIEQNARVFREALGEGSEKFILEHHSLSEPKSRATQFGKKELQDDLDEEAAERLAENWDSRVILTTAVQFFESLFAREPGRCRKLHNIARSVVIIDECQSLPKELLDPTCQMLSQLKNWTPERLSRNEKLGIFPRCPPIIG